MSNLPANDDKSCGLTCWSAGLLAVYCGTSNGSVDNRTAGARWRMASPAPVSSSRLATTSCAHHLQTPRMGCVQWMHSPLCVAGDHTDKRQQGCGATLRPTYRYPPTPPTPRTRAPTYWHPAHASPSRRSVPLAARTRCQTAPTRGAPSRTCRAAWCHCAATRRRTTSSSSLALCARTCQSSPHPTHPPQTTATLPRHHRRRRRCLPRWPFCTSPPLQLPLPVPVRGTMKSEDTTQTSTRTQRRNAVNSVKVHSKHGDYRVTGGASSIAGVVTALMHMVCRCLAGKLVGCCSQTCCSRWQ